jgi:hypothetical protein
MAHATPPRASRTGSTGLWPLLARLVVVMVGVTGVFAAGYGALILWAVGRDWLPCVNPSFVPTGDYASNYCQTVPWATQFAVGIGLLAGGVLGTGAAIWLLRSRYAARAPRK